MLRTPAQRSVAVLEMAQAGRFGEIRQLFAAPLRPLVSAEALRAAWEAELARHGPVSAVGAAISDPAHAGVIVVKIPVTFERGAVTLVVAVTKRGRLAGLQLAAASAAEPTVAWAPPDYAHPTTFGEQDLELRAGQLAVPATLSLPHQPGLRPGVVLLAGSGPQDRDETIGRNKPLKDLAWGLASRGIAVVRFDKITYAHPDVAQPLSFTIADEYVPCAVAAIDVLRQHPDVDTKRIFLLGHSLGGTVAPLVATAERTVAGLVILAGGAQPLHWAIVRQVRYLASLNPATAAASDSTIEALIKQATLVDGPELTAATPAEELPLGVPAPYWLDLRDYKPAEAAAMLDKPMLILQGGRDYQVTVAEDLAKWQACLADRSDVTINVYPPLNHMFCAGTGPPNPSEYEPTQHVDPTVVADIALWLRTIVAGSA
jgi:dienelactone hydrolase